MNAMNLAVIAALQLCLGGWIGATESGGLLDFASKAFDQKQVLHSRNATEKIEESIKALADASLEKLKSGSATQKKVAARILGILRERRAIDLLVENIGLVENWREGASAKAGLNLADDYPACAALKNIGGAEVVAAVRKFRESKTLDNKTLNVVEVLLSEL